MQLNISCHYIINIHTQFTGTNEEEAVRNRFSIKRSVVLNNEKFTETFSTIKEQEIQQILIHYLRMLSVYLWEWRCVNYRRFSDMRNNDLVYDIKRRDRGTKAILSLGWSRATRSRATCAPSRHALKQFFLISIPHKSGMRMGERDKRKRDRGTRMNHRTSW